MQGINVDALDPFVDEGWISEIVYQSKSGKEATVYCCRAGVAAPHPGELLAAKVYRSLDKRSFRHAQIYQAGRVERAHNTRILRALRNNSVFGKSIQNAVWSGHEWETMMHLYEGGADVPEPLRNSENAILMPFIGDQNGPAPMLNDVSLSRDDVQRVVDVLLENVEIMLDLHRVHGDLSPYNVLYWEGRATIIDFPQAIDPRLNPAGLQLLQRDIDNVCRWAAKYNVHRDAARIGSDLWTRFQVGELG